MATTNIVAVIDFLDRSVTFYFLPLELERGSWSSKSGFLYTKLGCVVCKILHIAAFLLRAKQVFNSISFNVVN